MTPLFPRYISEMSVRITRSAVVGALIFSSVFGVPRGAHAESDDDEPAAPTVTIGINPLSFSGAFGIAAIRRELKSSDGCIRAAAVERAAEIGTDEAWKLVEDATTDSVGDDLDAMMWVRLTALRSLARSPRKAERMSRYSAIFSEPTPIVTLTRPVYPYGGYGPYSPYPPPAATTPPRAPATKSAELVRLLRETAAFLIAQQDVVTLFSRVRSQSLDTESSRAALPALLSTSVPDLPKIDGTYPDSNFVAWIARLGDLRGADLLLRAVSDPSLGGARAGQALIALARLGDGRTLSLAKSGLTGDRPLRVASVEALGELGENIDPLLAALASAKETADEAVRLAIKFPSPATLPILEPRARAGDPGAIAAIGLSMGRSESADATTLALLEALARSERVDTSIAALHTLASQPTSGARDRLAALLSTAKPDETRRILRACAYRLALGASSVSGASSAAERLRSSKDPSDRFVSALYLAVDSSANTHALLRDTDVDRRRGAVAGLSTLGAKASGIARERLREISFELGAKGEAVEDDQVLVALVAIAAKAVDGTLDKEVPIPTDRLVSWLSEEGMKPGVAAFVLASRSGAVAAAATVRALASPEIAIRVQALLGLAVNTEPGSVGQLAHVWANSAQPILRRAAVQALALRGDVSTAIFQPILRTEPDPEIRLLARQAASRASLPHVRAAPLRVARPEVLSLTVASPSSETRLGYVQPNGTMIPVTMSPDGLALVGGVMAGGRLDIRSVTR